MKSSIKEIKNESVSIGKQQTKWRKRSGISRIGIKKMSRNDTEGRERDLSIKKKSCMITI